MVLTVSHHVLQQPGLIVEFLFEIFELLFLILQLDHQVVSFQAEFFTGQRQRLHVLLAVHHLVTHVVHFVLLVVYFRHIGTCFERIFRSDLNIQVNFKF